MIITVQIINITDNRSILTSATIALSAFLNWELSWSQMQTSCLIPYFSRLQLSSASTHSHPNNADIFFDARGVWDFLKAYIFVWSSPVYRVQIQNHVITRMRYLDGEGNFNLVSPCLAFRPNYKLCMNPDPNRIKAADTNLVTSIPGLFGFSSDLRLLCQLRSYIEWRLRAMGQEASASMQKSIFVGRKSGERLHGNYFRIT